MLQTAGYRKWHKQYWTPPREFQRKIELTWSFNELFVFRGPHHSLAVHIFLCRPDNDFLLLMFSCFKPLMADSLSPTLGTVSRHLLPRSLSVRPVAAPRSTLQHITRRGPKQGCTSGVAAGHQPQVLRSTSQLTVSEQLHPQLGLRPVGKFSADRSQKRVTRSMGRTSSPPREDWFV